MAKPKITDINLYELLETVSTATEQEIKKAYRKSALKCHPDKNPDNPRAAELFHQLSEALEILLDPKAREAYDRTLKAKALAKERTKELDAKRRKLKEDLERREKQAKDSFSSGSTVSDEEKLQKEIDRLRKEGSNALREEQEIIRQQILREQQGKFSFVQSSVDGNNSTNSSLNVPRIKIKWSSSVIYDYNNLLNIFSKYGEVTALVVLKKSALIEFANQKDADNAYDTEAAKSSNSITLEWVSKKCKSEAHNSASSRLTSSNSTSSVISGSNPSNITSNAAKTFADFEAMILNKLSAAAAAQKMIPSTDPSSVPSNSSPTTSEPQS